MASAEHLARMLETLRYWVEAVGKTFSSLLDPETDQNDALSSPVSQSSSTRLMMSVMVLMMFLTRTRARRLRGFYTSIKEPKGVAGSEEKQ